MLDALDAFLAEERDVLLGRLAEGHVVEGHGDLRPEHVFLGEPPAVIDCLEFDRALRLLARRRAEVYDDLVPLVPGRLDLRRGDLLGRVVDDVDVVVDERVRVRQPLLVAAASCAGGPASTCSTRVVAVAGRSRSQRGSGTRASPSGRATNITGRWVKVCWKRASSSTSRSQLCRSVRKSSLRCEVGSSTASRLARSSSRKNLAV